MCDYWLGQLPILYDQLMGRTTNTTILISFIRNYIFYEWIMEHAKKVFDWKVNEIVETISIQFLD